MAWWYCHAKLFLVVLIGKCRVSLWPTKEVSAAGLIEQPCLTYKGLQDKRFDNVRL